MLFCHLANGEISIKINRSFSMYIRVHLRLDLDIGYWEKLRFTLDPDSSEKLVWKFKVSRTMLGFPELELPNGI